MKPGKHVADHLIRGLVVPLLPLPRVFGEENGEEVAAVVHELRHAMIVVGVLRLQRSQTLSETEKVRISAVQNIGCLLYTSDAADEL